MNVFAANTEDSSGESASIDPTSPMVADNDTVSGPTNRSSLVPLLSQTPAVTALYSIAYTAILLLSLVNNSAVLTVIRKNPQMKTVTNYFLANLAAADLIVTFTVLPITLLSNIFTEWHFGWFLCKTVPYIQAVAVSASVNTLTSVSFERYCVIHYPTRLIIRPSTAFWIIFVIWALPVFCTQIPWVIFYKHTVRPPWTICYQDTTDTRLVRGYFLGVVFLTCYLLPLCLITVFYSLIGVKVCQRKVSGIRGSKTERNIQASKVRIIRMLVTVAVVFALSWLPLYVIRLRILFGPGLQGNEKVVIQRYVAPVAQWLGAANSCVNPFIYCYFSKPFRSSILAVLGGSLGRLVPCCWRGQGGSSSQAVRWPDPSNQGSFVIKTELSRLRTMNVAGQQ